MFVADKCCTVHLHFRYCLINVLCVPSHGYFQTILLFYGTLSQFCSENCQKNCQTKTLHFSSAKQRFPCICFIGIFSDRENLELLTVSVCLEEQLWQKFIKLQQNLGLWTVPFVLCFDYLTCTCFTLAISFSPA